MKALKLRFKTQGGWHTAYVIDYTVEELYSFNGYLLTYLDINGARHVRKIYELEQGPLVDLDHEYIGTNLNEDYDKKIKDKMLTMELIKTIIYYWEHGYIATDNGIRWIDHLIQGRSKIIHDDVNTIAKEMGEHLPDGPFENINQPAIYKRFQKYLDQNYVDHIRLHNMPYYLVIY